MDINFILALKLILNIGITFTCTQMIRVQKILVDIAQTEHSTYEWYYV